MWRRFWHWLRGSHTARYEWVRITLYTRRGCHLCDVARERLEAEQPNYGFQLDRIDVDGTPELAARFGETVPVVVVNGKVRFRGAVNPVLLRRLLTAEARFPPR